jgi:hypothetical protein
VAATFEKANTWRFAGSLIRNTAFSGANRSMDLDLIDKQMGAPSFVAKLCPEKTADEV